VATPYVPTAEEAKRDRDHEYKCWMEDGTIADRRLVRKMGIAAVGVARRRWKRESGASRWASRAPRQRAPRRRAYRRPRQTRAGPEDDPGGEPPQLAGREARPAEVGL
jgi:hypothetical protein